MAELGARAQARKRDVSLHTKTEEGTKSQDTFLTIAQTAKKLENGIKDLVGSYFIDEIFGLDPVKVEFEFYCVMLARLAYEYFLKELGGQYYNNVDGNKYTLQTMRNLLFEKRNCNIEQDLVR